MCCVFSHQTQMLKRHNREIEVVFALENFWPQSEGGQQYYVILWYMYVIKSDPAYNSLHHNSAR